MKGLAGTRVVVTGGASGIGAATVERLVAEGAAVACLDARANAGTALAVRLSAGRPGVAVHAFECDVGDEASVRSAIGAAAGALGGLDSVVTCAGIARFADTHTLDLAEWEAVLRVNLTGTFLAVKHALPWLMAGGGPHGGAVVTVGSVASVVAAGRASSYDASKGGVLQFTRHVAAEYASHGIRANCVCPGVVRTGLGANTEALHGASPPRLAEAPSQRTRPPFERAADPAEVAAVIAFLCSADASFMTGAAVSVDGGYTAI